MTTSSPSTSTTAGKYDACVMTNMDMLTIRPPAAWTRQR